MNLPVIYIIMSTQKLIQIILTFQIGVLRTFPLIHKWLVCMPGLLAERWDVKIEKKIKKPNSDRDFLPFSRSRLHIPCIILTDMYNTLVPCIHEFDAALHVFIAVEHQLVPISEL